jgi:hypothetical protein
MFEVGDRVEVIADDPLVGCFGNVIGVFPEHGFITIMIDDGADIGNPVLWYNDDELRKVEA